MVQTNKILTVSYGTFSCTLEGFDDSFETMKAIAEYFRDLAADDRYFGAEPPQPDADMLARIAQKEISRQVEAHQGEDGILLRAASPAALQTPAESEPPAPQTQPADAPMAPEIAQEPAPKAADQAESVAETVTPFPVASDLSDEAEETVLLDDQQNGADADATVTEAVEIFEPSAPADTNVESMADKLARIRAVVERNDALVEEQIEDLVEPEETPQEAVSTGADDQMFEDQGNDDESVIAQHSEQPDMPAMDETTDMIGAVMSDQAPVEPEPQSEHSAAPYALTDGVLSEEDDESAEDESLFGDLTEDDFEDEADEDNILADAPAPTIAQALEAKRDEMEQAYGSDAPLAEDLRAGAVSEAGYEKVSSLTDADEADLQTELDAVAAELAEAQAALNPPDDDEDLASKEENRPRAGRGDAIKDTSPPVTRLLEETEGKMDDPEAAMSREAYDHLRAAVVATRAEEEANKDAGEPKALISAEYHEDLANVVKPRRPETAGAIPRARRPDEARPAPLKLVAEQRVDADSILPQRGPIRPRRVAADADEFNETGDAQGGDFAAFAEEVGARELPELLEAAAAYMSFVEGWEQFSRPQLMTRVKQVENSGFNREDGLRTFGQLLREGKIEKTSGGRFTASERIGYRPARKAAG